MKAFSPDFEADKHDLSSPKELLSRIAPRGAAPIPGQKRSDVISALCTRVWWVLKHITLTPVNYKIVMMQPIMKQARKK